MKGCINTYENQTKERHTDRQTERWTERERVTKRKRCVYYLLLEQCNSTQPNISLTMPHTLINISFIYHFLIFLSSLMTTHRFKLFYKPFLFNNEQNIFFGHGIISPSYQVLIASKKIFQFHQCDHTVDN